MIVISVFVAVLSSDPKFPISERRAITGAPSAYYQRLVLLQLRPAETPRDEQAHNDVVHAERCFCLTDRSQ